MMTPGGIDGRLLLMHGAPGTGKTTLLRALARQWRDWCQADCVLDPEFPPAEAAGWLREHGAGASRDLAFAAPVTLAELYALRGGQRAAGEVGGVPPVAVGQYL